jgi:hypothetical protein
MKSTKSRLALCAVLVTLVSIAVPVWAHHGTAAFDTAKEVTVKGTIIELIFSNPHVQIHWEAKTDNGEKEQWQGELTSPNKLARAGWTKNSLKPGDQVTISGFQVKNGNRTLWIRKLIGPDGEAMQLFED